jgi:histidine triad (HIT) family protein
MSADFQENCLFCNIANHLEPAEIISEDEELIVIRNKFPKAPVHLLVMPKRHLSKDLAHVSDQNGLYDKSVRKCGETAENMGLAKGDYKIIINGSALAHFDHEHLHFMGGWRGQVPDWE